MAIGATLYGCWLIACFGCHVIDAAVFFPTQQPIPLTRATSRPIAVNDGTLEAWVDRSAAARTTTAPAAFVLRVV